MFDLFFGWLETECSERHLEMLHLNGTSAILVEEVEGFFDLLLLFFSELLPDDAFLFALGLHVREPTIYILNIIS